MKKENFTLGLSVLAIVLSIIAVCFSLYREPNLGFDYQGVLVGALSTLVAILIAWQIRSLIDIERVKKEIKEYSNNTYIQSEKNQAIIFMSMSDYYYSTLAGEDQSESEKLYKYIYNRVSSILHASRIGDIRTCETVIKVLIQTIHPENIQMSANDKKSIVDLLSGIRNAQQISGFSELLIHISKIIENP